MVELSQLGSVIKAAYEAEPDTNAFTDAEKTKLMGIAIGATNAQIGTAYTLLAADSGKIVTLNNASPITLTVPSGLGAGFNCTVIQKGAGVVTFAGTGTTLINRQGQIGRAHV